MPTTKNNHIFYVIYCIIIKIIFKSCFVIMNTINKINLSYKYNSII